MELRIHVEELLLVIRFKKKPDKYRVLQLQKAYYVVGD